MIQQSQNAHSADAIGAARFSQLLRVISGAFFLVLVIASIHQLYVYKYDLDSGDPYSTINKEAALVYYSLWSGVAALAFATTFHRRSVFLSLYVTLLLLAEAVAYLFFFATHLHLFHPTAPVLFDRFEAHPLTIARPHPGVFGAITHDAKHRRTTVNQAKIGNPKFLFVFGGSTTYDAGNKDGDTWPSQLSALLGPDIDVENFGVPGFSSVENLVQSLFAFRDQRPSCAVYYEGWNDLQNSHIDDLQVDYSDFEAPELIQVLALGHRPGFLENNSALVAYIASIFAPPGPARVRGVLSDEKDQRLSAIYQENMRLISAVGREFGVKVIFIPQVLNYAMLTADSPYGWLPFVRDKDVKKLMALMNQDLAAAAASSGALFVDAPLFEHWTGSDFVDQGHFSALGARKFAASIASVLGRVCR